MQLSTIVWKSLCCVNYHIHHASFTETLARVGPTYWALLEEHPWFGLRLPSSYSQLTSARSLCKLSPEDPLGKSCYFFPDTRDQRSLLIQLFSKYSRCMRDFFPFLAYISHGRIAFACMQSLVEFCHTLQTGCRDSEDVFSYGFCHKKWPRKLLLLASLMGF